MSKINIVSVCEELSTKQAVAKCENLIVRHINITFYPVTQFNHWMLQHSNRFNECGWENPISKMINL